MRLYEELGEGLPPSSRPGILLTMLAAVCSCCVLELHCGVQHCNCKGARIPFLGVPLPGSRLETGLG